MYSLLLAVIYLSFISLGLPDSLLGSAWPVMQHDFSVPLSYAGIVSMIISIGTVVSSLMSDRLSKKFSVRAITATSVLITALALFAFSISQNFIMICLFAVPYGLGAGAIDAALNNYVAINYSTKHMSWLHCCWGVGATISPYIMGFSLSQNLGWQNGYLSVSIIQIVITAMIFLSFPLWKKQKHGASHEELTKNKNTGLLNSLKIPGVKAVLISFFAYIGIESTVGMWAATYLVSARDVSVETAALFTSFSYIGITVGRFLCGFVANKIGDKNLIRYGTLTIVFGLILVLIPIPTTLLALAGLIIIGLGSAPIYPAIIHSTPSNFGKANSQSIIGLQMAGAYMGATVLPPLFGVLGGSIGLWLYAPYLLCLAAVMLIFSEKLNSIVKHKKSQL